MKKISMLIELLKYNVLILEAAERMAMGKKLKEMR